MKLIALIVCILWIDLISSAEESDLLPRTYEAHKGVDVACKGTRPHLNVQMREVMCMPRKSLVNLRSEPGYVFLPNMVSVNRCGGFCGSNLSCMETETLVKPILVRRQHLNSSELSCYRVYVEEHTRCKCKCNVQMSDCNKNQVYVENECACKCINYSDRLKCESMKGMIWNAEKCKCTCIMSEEECSSGLEWIPSMCRCGKVMSPNTYM